VFNRVRDNVRDRGFNEGVRGDVGRLRERCGDVGVGCFPIEFLELRLDNRNEVDRFSVNLGFAEESFEGAGMLTEFYEFGGLLVDCFCVVVPVVLVGEARSRSVRC